MPVMKHRNPVFRLALEAGESRTLYIAAHSEGSLTLELLERCAEP